jgi:CBS domain-containing protein
VVSGEELVGLVTLDDVRRVERERWGGTTLREIMTPRERLVTVGPRDDALDAIAVLGRHQLSHCPVMDQGRLVGLLRLQDIPRWLSIYGEERESGAPRHSFAR